MNKLPLLLAALVATAGAGLAHDVQAYERGRTVQRGDRSGQVSAWRSNARFDSQRQRQWQGDGDGNASASRSGHLNGSEGGSANTQGSAWRHDDGSAGRQGSTSFSGPEGASLDSSGGISRDGDGNFSGSRSTEATGRDGNHYSGTTTVANGSLVHSGSCSNAAGETVACRGGR